MKATDMQKQDLVDRVKVTCVLHLTLIIVILHLHAFLCFLLSFSCQHQKFWISCQCHWPNFCLDRCWSVTRKRCRKITCSLRKELKLPRGRAHRRRTNSYVYRNRLGAKLANSTVSATNWQICFNTDWYHKLATSVVPEWHLKYYWSWV